MLGVSIFNYNFSRKRVKYTLSLYHQVSFLKLLLTKLWISQSQC